MGGNTYSAWGQVFHYLRREGERKEERLRRERGTKKRKKREREKKRKERKKWKRKEIKEGKKFKKKGEREKRTAPNEICQTTIPHEYVVFVWVAYDCRSDVVNASYHIIRFGKGSCH